MGEDEGFSYQIRVCRAIRFDADGRYRFHVFDIGDSTCLVLRIVPYLILADKRLIAQRSNQHRDDFPHPFLVCFDGDNISILTSYDVNKGSQSVLSLPNRG